MLRNPLTSRCVAACFPTLVDACRSLHEVYYLWTVAGGGLEAEFFRQGYVKPKVPIMDIEVYVAQPGRALFSTADRLVQVGRTSILQSDPQRSFGVYLRCNTDC